jgi:hypothetical protein
MLTLLNNNTDHSEYVVIKVNMSNRKDARGVENVMASGLRVQLHSHRERRKKTTVMTRALQGALKYM